jgi:hypothetical protein
MTGVKAAAFVAVALAVWALFLKDDERAQLKQRIRARLTGAGP